MIRPVSKLNQYVYLINDLQITSPNISEPMEIEPTKIKSLTISNQYIENIAPVIGLIVSIQYNKYNEIINNQNSLFVSFSVQRTIVENGKIDNVNQETVFKGKFKAENQDMVNTKLPNKIDSTIQKDKNTSSSGESFIALNLYLYDYKKIISYKSNKSYMLNASLNDCLYAIFNDRQLDNILFEPISDHTSYNIALPYGNLGDNLKELNNTIGLYDNPYIFYMGIDHTYMIQLGSKNCLQPYEYQSVNIYLEKLDDISNNTYGSYTDKENGLYVLSAPPIELENYDNMVDFAYGGTVQSLVVSKNKVDDIEDTIGEYKITKPYIVTNEKLHKQEVWNVEKNKQRISLSFSNIDVSIITPNKTFTIISDQTMYPTEYNIDGKYQLIASNLIFNRNSETYFKLETVLTLV